MAFRGITGGNVSGIDWVAPGIIEEIKGNGRRMKWKRNVDKSDEWKDYKPEQMMYDRESAGIHG